MKHATLFAALLLPAILFSQKNKIVIRIYAFYERRMPGNIRVNDNRRPVENRPTIIDLLYAETSSNEIKWRSAWKNGKTFTISSLLITTIPFEVGRKKSNKEKIILVPAKGNQLWQLELQPSEKNKISPLKAKANEIILEGYYQGKRILKKINKQVELDAPNAV